MTALSSKVVSASSFDYLQSVQGLAAWEIESNNHTHKSNHITPKKPSYSFLFYQELKSVSYHSLEGLLSFSDHIADRILCSSPLVCPSSSFKEQSWYTP